MQRLFRWKGVLFNTMELSREKCFSNQIIFVSGMNGSGKTLFSKILSSFDRVELMSLSVELEMLCLFHTLKKVSKDDTEVMVRYFMDLKAYNTMMSRDLNFRLDDATSALNYHNPEIYLERLASPGGPSTEELIERKMPVLNIALHNGSSYFDVILSALQDRARIVEVVRHPLTMIDQQAYQLATCSTKRGFTPCYKYNGVELPYHAFGMEDLYIKSNDYERAILFSEKYIKEDNVIRRDIISKYGNDRLLTIPFEKFVTNPEKRIRKLELFLNLSKTSVTNSTLEEENVPRKLILDVPYHSSYERYGYKEMKAKITNRQLLDLKRSEIESKVSGYFLDILDKLVEDYERYFWRP